jgi:hypothetical protein
MIRMLSMVGLLFVTTMASAVEVEGVVLPERIELPPDAASLGLNGAGKRSKFFISIYVGALYLPTKRSDAKAILEAIEPRRVAMHFVYDRVEAHKLRDAWEEGFVENQSAKAMQSLRERLERFKALFGDAVAGDVVWLDFAPGQCLARRRTGRQRSQARHARRMSQGLRIALACLLCLALGLLAIWLLGGFD